MEALSGKRVTVMGLGRFGGGLGATKWLVAQGALVTVTDVQPAEKLAESLAEIRPLVEAGRVTLHLGGHDERDFTETDLVIANPAVPRPWENRYLLAAGLGPEVRATKGNLLGPEVRATGVPINTEIGLLVERLQPGVMTIGVTGSVGKSTTTAMIDHALRSVLGDSRPVFMGGNIGRSLLERLPMPSDAIVILELSSFMLHWLGLVQRWTPRVAVCTNIAANHLDWHGSMEHYVSSKQNLIRFQGERDVVVLGGELVSWAGVTRARCVVVRGSMERRLAVPGAHNRVNAAVAVAACAAALPGVDPRRFEEAIASFPGLEHRLQLCHEVAARRWRFYNDSKCTTPEATLTAVASLAEERGGDTRHIHLIAGGYDKGADLSAVAVLAAAGRLGGLYCIGATGSAIARAAGDGAVECGSLERAVAMAAGRMRDGDVLLLSPACASWDQFTNYEYRGNRFVELVRALR